MVMGHAKIRLMENERSAGDQVGIIQPGHALFLLRLDLQTNKQLPLSYPWSFMLHVLNFVSEKLQCRVLMIADGFICTMTFLKILKVTIL